MIAQGVQHHRQVGDEWFGRGVVLAVAVSVSQGDQGRDGKRWFRAGGRTGMIRGGVFHCRINRCCSRWCYGLSGVAVRCPVAHRSGWPQHEAVKAILQTSFPDVQREAPGPWAADNDPLLVQREAPHNRRIEPTPGGKAAGFSALRGSSDAPFGLMEHHATLGL